MTDELYTRLTVVQKKRAQIRSAESDLRTMRELMLSAKSARCDAERVQSTPRDPLSDYEARKEAQQKKIDALRDELPEVARAEIALIRRTSRPEYAEVLIGMYVKGTSAAVIAKQIGYSENSVWRFRRQGIAELEQIVAKDESD